MRKLDTSEHAFLLRALTDAKRLAVQDAKNYLAAAKVYEPVLPGSHTREAEQAVARGEWLTRFIAELEATEVHVGVPDINPAPLTFTPEEEEATIDGGDDD